MRFVVAGALLIGLCCTAHAQPRAVSSLDSLGDAAAVAAARYADRRMAASDGYHRIGPDFPGMGEHWLHPSVLLSGRVSAEQPTLLMYATIAGKPTLLGVGFVTTTDRDHPVRDVPGWPYAWHEHSGLLSDESGVAPGSTSSGDTHVWVLHVWTAFPNADGRFTPDNWALPFVRAGLAAPAAVNADAARAVSLASGGDRYVRDVLTDANVRGTSNSSSIDAAVATASARVTRMIGTMQIGRAATAAEQDSLAREWTRLVATLTGIVGQSVERYLAPAHASSTAHHGTSQ